MGRAADVTALVEGPGGRGVPWRAGGTDLATGVDCKYLAWEALRACGCDVPWHALIGGRDLSDAALAAYQAAHAAMWDEVPRATRLGDLVVSRDPEAAGPHLSVLVDEGRGLVLTTSRRTQARLLPAAAIPSVACVLRFRGAHAAGGAA